VSQQFAGLADVEQETKDDDDVESTQEDSGRTSCLSCSSFDIRFHPRPDGFG